MKKWIKITLYCLLAIVIVAVIRLMVGNNKLFQENPTDIQSPTPEENINENVEPESEEIVPETNTFEEDVMKDLEGFFNDNNGYEDVQGEYGFTNPENE